MTTTTTIQQNSFMPRSEQFGYIFKSNDDIGTIIARELGHGVFQLKHTFDSDYGLGQDALSNNFITDRQRYA
jgi:hypothetical protein